MPLNWDVGEDSESPLDNKEIKLANPKGNQPWIFIGRTDAEAPILWPPDAKNWLIGKDPDAGKDWRQEKKQAIEDEMIGWHHLLIRHEFEETPGVGDGQGSLVCCSAWGHKELDTTGWLNWTEPPVAGSGKNLLAIQETWLPFLCLKDPKWQPTPVFLPGKSHGQRNLTSYSHDIARVGHDLPSKPPLHHNISCELVIFGLIILRNIYFILSFLKIFIIKFCRQI